MILNERFCNIFYFIANPPYICPGKFLILIYYPECSQTIRVQDFLNSNTHETMEL